MKLKSVVAVALFMQLCATAWQNSSPKSRKPAPPSSRYSRSLGPRNPYMAGGGAATEHNDSYSSDVSPLPGPGADGLTVSFIKSGSICPTLVLDRGGLLFAYCLEHVNNRASLRLLDPSSLTVLASLDMPMSGRLGGFYMYMDGRNRLVLGAGNNHLLRIGHTRNHEGKWNLTILDDRDLSRYVTGHCGSDGCDYLESVTPDWQGRIWFSSEGGLVGTLNPQTGITRIFNLPQGERVANSISSSPLGVAVPSDHALYLFSSSSNGTPVMHWREPYGRGTKIKLGQLSQGTGTTPVFFGPSGYTYVAITDNDDSQEHLLVYRVTTKQSDTDRQVCKVPVFEPGASAAENAPIGIGNSVVVANTSGYDYTDYTGRAVHPLPGGMVRIDVNRDGSGCDTVWANRVPSAAVPKLSLLDGNIYTVARAVEQSQLEYSFVTVSMLDGKTMVHAPIGNSYAMDSFQLAGLIGPNRILYQPTIAGIVKVSP